MSAEAPNSTARLSVLLVDNREDNAGRLASRPRRLEALVGTGSKVRLEAPR